MGVGCRIEGKLRLMLMLAVIWKVVCPYLLKVSLGYDPSSG